MEGFRVLESTEVEEEVDEVDFSNLRGDEDVVLSETCWCCDPVEVKTRKKRNVRIWKLFFERQRIALKG